MNPFLMHRFVEVVKKWCKFPDSVSLQELITNKERAFSAWKKVFWEYDVDEKLYWRVVRLCGAAIDSSKGSLEGSAEVYLQLEWYDEITGAL